MNGKRKEKSCLRKGLEKDMLSKQEISCLYALTLTLIKFDLPRYCYFGSYAAERICINKKGNLWEVFDCEGGKIYTQNTYLKCYGACVEVIRRLSISSHDLAKAVTVFNKLSKYDFSHKELEEFTTYYEFDKFYFTKRQKEQYTKYNEKLSKIAQEI